MGELRVFAESSLPILTGNHQVYVVHSVPNLFALRQSGECRQTLGIQCFPVLLAAWGGTWCFAWSQAAYL